MYDMGDLKPDAVGLFGLASEQMGHFTAEQARAYGMSKQLVAHHIATGRFIHVRRGLYRFRDYPSSLHDEVMAAWLAAGKETAVVSHESALVLLDLSDVVPHAVHLLIPRSRRGLVRPWGVALHTTRYTLAPGDVVTREGMRVTAPLRTVLDVAETGTASEQVIMAVEQTKRRGWATDALPRERARSRGARVAELIERGLQVA